MPSGAAGVVRTEDEHVGAAVAEPDDLPESSPAAYRLAQRVRAAGLDGREDARLLR